MSVAADRLLAVHNIRAFELYVANVANQTATPALAWVSATVAVVRAEVEPTVVVLVGLKARAWLALGVLHLVAWWRVRAALGKRRQGYRVRVRFAGWLPIPLLLPMRRPKSEKPSAS